METIKFTPEEIKALKKFAQEGLLSLNPVKRIPLDRKFTTTRSVRIPTKLLEMVLEKEPNFNAVVEKLLFEFVGCRPELLK